MKLKICIIIICLIIFGCKSKEEPLITKEGTLIKENEIYYLKVETETPTAIYEIINPGSRFDDFMRFPMNMKITGNIIIEGNSKKIYIKYYEAEFLSYE